MIARNLRRQVRRVPVVGPASADAFWSLLSLARSTRQKLLPTTSMVTSDNTRAAYEQTYRSSRLLRGYLGNGRLEFYDRVALRCAELRPRSVIDIGAGTGHLLAALARRVSDPCTFTGVDQTSAGIRRAQALLPQARWIRADLYELDLDERFDLVVCTEVLEHLPDPAGAISILRRLCMPDGHLVLTVPDGAVDSWEGHVNFWTAAQLADFLAPHGLVSVEQIEAGTLMAVLDGDPR